MSLEKDVAVDLALAEVKAVKKLTLEARSRYSPIKREIALLESQEADCTAETVARLSKIKLLNQEALRLFDAFHRPFDAVREAAAKLRQVNGVSTESVVTPEIAELVAVRLAQGYSLNDVAMMIGCTSATVANLKAGRYLISNLPATVKIGSRGHKRSSLKVL